MRGRGDGERWSHGRFCHCLGYITSSARTSWVGTPTAYPFESIQGLACRCDADLAEGIELVRVGDPA